MKAAVLPLITASVESNVNFPLVAPAIWLFIYNPPELETSVTAGVVEPVEL